MLLYKLFFLVCSYFSLSAFDVRVLLQRYVHDDKGKSSCVINSQHGVMIAGLPDKIKGAITISCDQGKFLVNGNQVHQDFLTITPVLTAHHQKKIHEFVVQWLEKTEKQRIESFDQLDEFYEKFVLDRHFKDFYQLYDVLKKLIEQGLYSFVEPVEKPAISHESLCLGFQKSLQKDLKNLLIDAIDHKKPSKKMLQDIKKSPEIRKSFFHGVLDHVLLTFLHDYIITLPHKIIHQVIQEETGCLLFEKNKYLGCFYIVQDAQALLVINSLDIDDYLLSVIYSEGWPGWPMEVNKALVIASRTYLVEKIVQANKAKKSYHIVNSIKHQTYKGHHKYNSLKQAVDETHNVFLAYQGEPIVAMFDSCCGDVIPAKIEGMDYKKHPYLARSKPCNYCKKSWIYSWKKELSPCEIVEALQKDHPDILDIKDMTVVERDPAGLVKKVLVTTSTKKIYVAGKKMYSLFSVIKSFSYTIKKKGKNYIFYGKGYGHHMGLCQWGALGMVQDNWNYKKILQFYYPGTEFMKLSLSR